MKKKVMIVEDNFNMADLLKELIEDAGFECAHVASAEQAWQELSTGLSPDMILTDLNLGGMSGSDLLQRIQNIPALTDTPVILISGSLEAKEVARKYGFNGFIEKSRVDECLIPTMHDHLEKKRPDKASGLSHSKSKKA